MQSATLRFAFLPLGGHDRSAQRLGSEFIVFDATGGPCMDFNARVYNGEDEFYEPGENPFVIIAEPGEVAPTPGPWMSPL